MYLLHSVESFLEVELWYEIHHSSDSLAIYLQHMVVDSWLSQS